MSKKLDKLKQRLADLEADAADIRREIEEREAQNNVPDWAFKECHCVSIDGQTHSWLSLPNQVPERYKAGQLFQTEAEAQLQADILRAIHEVKTWVAKQRGGWVPPAKYQMYFPRWSIDKRQFMPNWTFHYKAAPNWLVLATLEDCHDLIASIPTETLYLAIMHERLEGAS